MALRLSEVEVKSPRGRVLAKWLGRCKFFSAKKIHVLVNEPDALRIRLYTPRHQYTIVASDGYLGCIAATRKSRPGEDWARGNDLPDGSFSAETLNAIMGAIIFYETLVVVMPKEKDKAGGADTNEPLAQSRCGSGASQAG